MVVIRSLRAINFRRLNIPEPLQLDRGFIIIKGRNEAGKSTLIEATLFGIYGDHQAIGAIRGNPQRGYAEVVNHRSRRALVEVEFEVEGRRYRVVRELEREGDSIKQTSARLIEVTSSERLIATGVKAVNEEVQRILRVSWREMLTTNIVAQKDLERIIEMSKGDRERIINLMMGLESYNKAISILDEERREKERRKSELEKSIRELEGKIGELEKLKEAIVEWRNALRNIQDELPKLLEREKTLKLARDYLEELYKALMARSKIESEIKVLEGQAKTLRQAIEDAERRLREYESELKAISEKRPLVAQELDKIGSELKQVQEMLRKSSELLLEMKRYYNEREEIVSRINRLAERISSSELEVKRLEAARAEIEELRAQKSRLEERLSHLSTPLWVKVGAVVSLSVAVLSLLLLNPLVSALVSLPGIALALIAAWRVKLQHSLRDQVVKLESELKAREALIPSFERERSVLEELLKEKSALEARVKELEELVSRVVGEYGLGRESLADAIDALEGEVERLKSREEELRRGLAELEAEEKALEDVEKRRRNDVEDLQRQLEELRSGLGRVEEERRRLEEEYRGIALPHPPQELASLAESGALTPQTPTLDTVKAAIGRVVDELNKIAQTRATWETRMLDLRERIREAEEKVSQLDKLRGDAEALRSELQQAEEDIAVALKAIEAMREISKKRREAFAPSVENYMSWVISYFTDGRYRAVKLNPENYDIEVYDSEAGRWMRRDIYSGGTNDQFLLAMRIAFTLTLLPGAKGSYPRFLVLDEPLGSSDVERRERIMKFFTGELTRYFDQIFLITHVDVDEPPNSTVVYIEDGRIARVSRVEQPEEQ
ncbi:SMC family ATPase [Infirmifilum lucidum]|uniref:SMC family ATPase n=1 Tax=Infirmifilum lucidum TaxID=2776706 RepID=A0A7L9FH54_9CREN|nr:SMC family ATPase [Infirmifilum lucidum]QOJ78662.1 SMC family ATPase [Infirmifilum lucidum]